MSRESNKIESMADCSFSTTTDSVEHSDLLIKKSTYRISSVIVLVMPH